LDDLIPPRYVAFHINMGKWWFWNFSVIDCGRRSQIGSQSKGNTCLIKFLASDGWVFANMLVIRN
jgi:hypothetical protein